MRRFTAAILILLLAMFTLTGCGKSEEKDQKQITVRIATDLNENDAAYRQLKRFAAKAEEASEGEIKVKLYPEAKWDSNDSLLAYLDTGALEMVCLRTDRLTAEVPEYALYSYPSLFSDAGAVSSYALSDSGRQALAMSKNYHLLGFTANGYSYFLHRFWAENYANYRGRSFYAELADTTASALDGLGIRVINEENSTPGMNHILTEGELDYLLQVNVINESDYITDPNVYYNLEITAVSPLFWQKLSDDEQNILTEAFNNALKEECAYQKDRSLKEILPEGGAGFIPWSTENKQTAYQALRYLSENYIMSSQNALGSYFMPTAATEEGV